MQLSHASVLLRSWAYDQPSGRLTHEWSEHRPVDAIHLAHAGKRVDVIRNSTECQGESHAGQWDTLCRGLASLRLAGDRGKSRSITLVLHGLASLRLAGDRGSIASWSSRIAELASLRLAGDPGTTHGLLCITFSKGRVMAAAPDPLEDTVLDSNLTYIDERLDALEAEQRRHGERLGHIEGRLSVPSAPTIWQIIAVIFGINAGIMVAAFVFTNLMHP